MGRPRLPDAVKAAKGTLQPCRVNKAAPKLDAAFLPPPPDHFTADEAAIWIELAGVVDPMRVATVADVQAFKELVYSVVLAERTYRSKKAGIVQKCAALKHARTALGEFGLTPASRGKVSVVSAPVKADPLAEFLS